MLRTHASSSTAGASVPQLLLGGLWLAAAWLLPVEPLWPQEAEEPPAEQPERDDEDERDEEAPPPGGRFRLGRVHADAGDLVEIPIQVDADRAASMLAFSFEFDPAYLEFVEPRLHPGVESMLANRSIDEVVHDWDVDADQGVVQWTLVVDFRGREAMSIPRGLLRQIGVLVFRVLHDAPDGEYAVTYASGDDADFESDFVGADGPVYNALRGFGEPFAAETLYDGLEDEPELLDGAILVPIIGDVGIFVRGDANLDFRVDISDPLRTLDFLFRGGSPLGCPSSADANADGSLDIGDPVTVLVYLFVGTSSWVPSEEPVGTGGASADLGCEALASP